MKLIFNWINQKNKDDYSISPSVIDFIIKNYNNSNNTDLNAKIDSSTPNMNNYDFVEAKI